MSIPQLGALMASESPVFKTRVIFKPVEAICHSRWLGREDQMKLHTAGQSTQLLPARGGYRRSNSMISTIKVEPSKAHRPARSGRRRRRAAAQVAAAEPASAAPRAARMADGMLQRGAGDRKGFTRPCETVGFALWRFTWCVLSGPVSSIAVTVLLESIILKHFDQWSWFSRVVEAHKHIQIMLPNQYCFASLLDFLRL